LQVTLVASAPRQLREVCARGSFEERGPVPLNGVHSR
jgi:hypothetical protein